MCDTVELNLYGLNKRLIYYELFELNLSRLDEKKCRFEFECGII